MLTADLSLLAMLAVAAFGAGLIDAVVGGGGLIQIPALFTVLPQQPAATLFGTNKFSSIFGTANAAWHFARRIEMPWRVILPAACTAFIGSYLGALAVSWLPREVMRPLILLLLICAAIYTFWRKDFGSIHRPQHAGQREYVLALLIGGVLGFYDGLFGPGTGSFLIFLFIRFFRFDFLHASAAAKFVNLTTNLAALCFFAPHGYLLPMLAATMAVFNVLGSIVGAQLALRRGSMFVRKIYLLVVSGLIVKFAWDTFA